jgi:hypothetical protein
MKPDELESLLPWYLNGTLEADEARAVEAYLARSPEAREELDELRVLQRAVAEVGEEEPVFRPTGIHEALRQIDLHERERARAAEASLGARMRRVAERLLPGLGETPFAPRLALAVQLALILALGGVVLTQLDGETGYGTLSGGAAGVGPQGGALLSVAFQPGATEAELRALLDEVGAAIVAGPSAQQLYTVELGVAPESAMEVERRMKQLESRADVVRYVARRKP